MTLQLRFEPNSAVRSVGEEAPGILTLACTPDAAVVWEVNGTLQPGNGPSCHLTEPDHDHEVTRFTDAEIIAAISTPMEAFAIANAAFQGFAPIVMHHVLAHRYDYAKDVIDWLAEFGSLSARRAMELAR